MENSINSNNLKKFRSHCVNTGIEGNVLFGKMAVQIVVWREELIGEERRPQSVTVAARKPSRLVGGFN